ncbi:hypothetical protein EGW08_005321, partial [Elysia chlorotica]
CNSSSCVCKYGYTNKTKSVCEERPKLQYDKTIRRERENLVTCEKPKDCLLDTICDDWRHCCVCKPKTARDCRTNQCVAVQTYQLLLNITHEADVYDYKPLEVGSSKEEEEQFVDRVILNGVQKLVNRTELKERLVSIELLRISDMRRRRVRRSVYSPSLDPGGKNVELLVHLQADYLNALPTEDVAKQFRDQIRSDGVIGHSGLQLGSPIYHSIKVIDYNECEADNATDCSRNANCLNTVGSYMCVCKPDFEDEDKTYDFLRMGKNCS